MKLQVKNGLEEFHIGDFKIIRDDHKCGMMWCPRENTKKEKKPDKWEDLKKWLEKQMVDRQCKNDFERYTAYENVLNKMIGLEGRK